MAKQSSTVYSEPAGRRTVGWTPAKLKQAEQQAANGKLMLAADLCERMFADDRFAGVLRTLGNVTSLPLEFEPGSDGADPATDPACLALGGSRGDWWRMLPESTMSEVVMWGSTLGVVLLQNREWIEDEQTGRVVPDVEVWSPRWLELRDGNWFVQTSQGIVQLQPGDSQWQLWTFYRRKRPHVVAPWSGLGLWWLAKVFAILDELDISDKRGDAKLVAEQLGIEYGLTPEDRVEMVNQLKGLGRKGVYAPPPGISLKLIESSGKGAELCGTIIEQANTAFAVTMLGGNLSAEVTGGSFAAASVHSQATHDRIRSLAEWIATESHYQLLMPWSEFNFGTRSAPWAKYDTSPPADKQARATQLATASQGVIALLDRGVPLVPQRLVDDYDLPIDVEALGDGPLVGRPQQEPMQARSMGRTFARARSYAERRALVDLVAARAADDQLDSAEGYVDRLERDGKVAMVQAMRPAVDELVGLVKAAGVEGAETEQERRAALLKLRSKVLDLYGSLDPELYAETHERIEILAAMAGAYSASSEV